MESIEWDGFVHVLSSRYIVLREEETTLEDATITIIGSKATKR
jgi:hypothetical protein